MAAASRQSRARRWAVAAHYVAAGALIGAGWWAWQRFGALGLARLAEAGYVVEDIRYLWTLALVPLLLVVRAHTLSDLPRLQQALSFVLKAGVVAAVALSMINVQGIRHDPVRTATVWIVDVSDSVPDAALARAGERISHAWERRGEHEVRVVRFAGRAEEVGLPSDPKAPFPAIERLEGDHGGETDVQGAMRLAFSLLPTDHLARVVLVTDGLETRGSLSAEVATARQFGIRVHHLDFTDVERPSELMVTGVEVPGSLKANVPFEATATVKSTARMTARCELTLDGVVSETREVTLDAGDNALTIETRVKEGGDRHLAVACEPVPAAEGVDNDPAATAESGPALDRFASNNRYEVPIHVPEKPKLLYVEGERKYRKNLLSALDKDFEVELRGARGVPATLADAGQFDLVFVSDVPRTGDMGVQLVGTQHMKALERYVRNGGGLIWAGGENSFGPGGYGGTYLERKVLPVLLDVQRKEDIPSLALVLVIDRSGSMSGPRMELAKEAARATLDVLQPSDKLGVIAFDSAPAVVVRLQRAANRLKITDSLSRLSPGGGTAIFPALDEAYQMLTSVQAKVKHVILLTDGQSNQSGIIDLVAQAYSEKITVSTVGVGMGSDQSLLMRVAETGGGRYYFTDRADNIPKLFLKEASEVSRRALVEDHFRPRVLKRFRKLQMFKGLEMKRVPPLYGYVSTRPKPRTEVLMQSHLGEPILARWRLGLGTSMVWTSDVKNKWAHSWLKWPGYAKFWRQVIRDTLRVERQAPAFEMVTDLANGVLTVGVDAVDEDDRFIEGLTSEVSVKGPDGTEHEVSLAQVAPGRYSGSVGLDQYGPWTVTGRHHPTDDPDAVHTSRAALSWPFPTEHLLGEPDLGAVRLVSEATGGLLEPTDAQIFDNEGRTIEAREPRWPLPLYLALALLLLDVLLRRVRLYGKTALAWSDVRG